MTRDYCGRCWRIAGLLRTSGGFWRDAHLKRKGVTYRATDGDVVSFARGL